MCEKYDTVYSCGHYKTQYGVCAKGNADEESTCEKAQRRQRKVHQKQVQVERVR